MALVAQTAVHTNQSPKGYSHRHLMSITLRLHLQRLVVCEPAWPGGKALGWSAEGRRLHSPLRLAFLSSTIVIYGHCLVTLPRTIKLMKH